MSTGNPVEKLNFRYAGIAEVCGLPGRWISKNKSQKPVIFLLVLFFADLVLSLLAVTFWWLFTCAPCGFRMIDKISPCPNPSDPPSFWRVSG